MKEIILITGGILIIGIVVLLCLSCCYLAKEADEFWEATKKELEKRNDRRRF